ncbi:hypothetical protein HK097_005217 [Rhizophlyctis rosea]|uniref:Thioredoxin-like fold domain-containing protein n=1 Tax=Rhizophlyctis rosea TaxID=64517 RepID=A0AAD5SDJ4_9FUNG|nr:hypothetical protein HK097_005217 [Rhizophlyctis rosea]
MAFKTSLDDVRSFLTSTSPTILIGSAAVALTFAYAFLRPKRDPFGPHKSTLHTSKFPPDTVIFHHASSDPEHALPSASMFVVKLESYLRLTNTPYQTEKIVSRSHPPKGKIPFISYNDEIIGDSSVIINYLTTHNLTRLTNPSLVLTPHQKALSKVIQSLVEDNLYWIQLRLRWGENFDVYARKAFFGPIPWPLHKPLSSYVQEKVIEQMQSQGVGRHTLAELLVFWQEGIQALDDLLGKQKWFIGEAPTATDCIVFGFLYNSLVIKELAPEFRKVVIGSKPLVAFTDRFMRSYWPDLVDKVETDGLLEP